MKVFIILLIFFVNSSNIFSELIKYRGNILNISSKVLIMEDETKNIKEEDIAKGLFDDKFKKYDKKVLYLWNPKAVYYIKIDIHNTTDKNELELYGWLGHYTIQRTGIKCFYIDKSQMINKNFTRKINEKDENSFFNYGYSSFKIAPGERKTIYIKSFPLTTKLFLTDFNNILENEKMHLALTFMLYALSFIVLFTILIFYLNLKKKYLLYYVIISIFAYLKSEMFFKSLTKYVSIFYADRVYAIAFMLYLFFLNAFVIEILKLAKRYIYIKNYLNFTQYLSIMVASGYILNIVDDKYFFKSISPLYLINFALILYAAIVSYKDSWLNKAFLFAWIPNWFLYSYLAIASIFELKIVPFDIRVAEYMDTFANLFLIAGILFYDSKELWKNRNRAQESDKFVKTLNKSENLMHALMNLVELYKKEIKHDRVMYFRRKLSRERDDLLFYDFSIPSVGDEREEEKKYYYLTKILHEDKFRTHFICNDIELSDLYKSILPEYKSMLIMRLSVVDDTDLGYVAILSKSREEYEYNETIKDFRYKISLLIQHFKTIDEIKEKYETRVVEETVRRFHIEILNDSKKDAEKILDAVSEAKRILNRLVGDKDQRMGKLSDHLFEEIEVKVKNIIEDLNFEDINKKTKNKILFKYKVIEEWVKVIEEVLRKISNKVTLDIKHEVNNSYLLEGHLQIVENILNYFLSYIYNKVNKEPKDTIVRLRSRVEDGRLLIKGIVEGINMTLEELQKEYRDEVQRVLLSRIRSKKYLKSKDGKIEITYMLNILTKEERDKANIKYLDYESSQEQEEIVIEEYENEVRTIKKTRKKLN